MTVKSLQELRQIRDEHKSKINLRSGDAGASSDIRDILVCGGTACLSDEGAKVQKNFGLILKARGYSDRVNVIATGCFGFCERGPIVKIEPDRVFYVHVHPKDVKDIVDEHIIGGRIVERLLYVDPLSKKTLKTSAEMPFYKKQRRIALRNCGLIDPEDIY
ncbi:MAG: (2Fe-2S) ferredoxin domain-containing protein, partial [Oscillospiraceae bacterium]|nr:(2Fe-2S) ferredoxin domain-containing protein [Oscillospiraceae bacterium]